VIPGYRAIIDPAAAGLGLEAPVQVTMDRQDASMIAGFGRGLAAIPEIRHPERLVSDPGHLVRAATARPGLLPGPARRETRHPPGVQRLTSTIVMKRILDDRPYPPRGPRAAPATGPSHADHPDQRGRRSIRAGRHGRPERRLGCVNYLSFFTESDAGGPVNGCTTIL
jgi:DNA-binding Lrp family transcriptional regulator